MKKKLVSLIVTTRNSEKTIEACLISLKNQEYKKIEIILVDNFSTDKTIDIAKKYTRNIYITGPERSQQRNFGIKKAKGEFVFFIDSDMQVDKKVVDQCLSKMEKREIVALIIPEESFGKGFWAKCKRLERSFYLGVDWMEAARFFRKEVFLKLEGFNTLLIAAEDWDLSQRAAEIGKIDRIRAKILHNEGNLSLLKTVRKKFLYSQNIKKYQAIQKKDNNIFKKKQGNLFARYSLFFSKPLKLFSNPILGFGMIIMKSLEFIAGSFGYLFSQFSEDKS